MYKLHISNKANRQLKEIAKNTTKEAVISALREIKAEPFLNKPLNQELSGKFTYKLGVYRIIYKINKRDKTINILNAGHRATIYE